MKSFLPEGYGSLPSGPHNLLTRLRTNIGARRHWVFVADFAPARFLLHALAEHLSSGGAAAGQVTILDIEHVLLRPYRQTNATLLVIAKPVLSRHQVAEFVGPVAAADIARGRDLFVIGPQPAALVALVCDIAAGRCYVPQADLN